MPQYEVFYQAAPISDHEGEYQVHLIPIFGKADDGRLSRLLVQAPDPEAAMQIVRDRGYVRDPIVQEWHGEYT